MIAASRSGVRHDSLVTRLVDNFNRADSTPPSPSPQGLVYTSPFGSAARIATGRIGGAAADWVAVTNIGKTPGDFDWSYTFVTGANVAGQPTDFIDLYFRVQDPSNRCFVELTNGTLAGQAGLAVFTYVGATLVKVVEAAATFKYVNPNEVHTLRVKSSGNVITTYLDGVQATSTTITALPLATGIGVHQASTTGYGVQLKGSSVPSTVFTDNFNRADSPLAAPYILLGGQAPLSVVTNRVASTAAATAYAYAALQTPVENLSPTNKLDITLTMIPGTNNDMAIRYFNNGIRGQSNFYFSQSITNNTVTRFAIQKAAVTVLVDTPTSGAVVTRFVSDGITAQFYVNGTKVYDGAVPADTTPGTTDVLLYTVGAGAFDDLIMLPIPA